MLGSIINWELHMALMEKRRGRQKIEKGFVFNNKQYLLRSMTDKILTFNGEDEMFIAESKMRDAARSRPNELVELFQSTAVYLDVIKELESDLGSALSSVNDSPLSKERKKRIEEGYRALADLMVEVFGIDAAGLIIADTHNAINLEKLRNGKG
jgi:hypothetical protein